MSVFGSLMMQSREEIFGGYVGNGLIFQLDCDKDCSASTWTDLIGGRQFDSNGGITLSGGVPLFNGSGCYKAQTSASIGDVNSHIEIVFKPTYKVSCFAFSNSLAQSPCVSLDTSYNITMLLHKTSATQYGAFKQNAGYTLNTVNIVSGYKNSAKWNKGTMTYVQSGTWGAGYYPAIGCRYNSNGTYSNYYRGYIYAIRIYNRALTSAEQSANMAIDASRFGTR